MIKVVMIHMMMAKPLSLVVDDSINIAAISSRTGSRIPTHVLAFSGSSSYHSTVRIKCRPTLSLAHTSCIHSPRMLNRVRELLTGYFFIDPLVSLVLMEDLQKSRHTGGILFQKGSRICHYIVID